MPVRGQRRTLAPTPTLSTMAWARRRRPAALTSASEVAGGAGPARMARAVTRSNRVALGLMGVGGGTIGAVAKVTGNDEAEDSKCHAVARKKAAFGAARCAYAGGGARGGGAWVRASGGCRVRYWGHRSRYGPCTGFARHGVSRYARGRCVGGGLGELFALGVPLGAQQEYPTRFWAEKRRGSFFFQVRWRVV